MTIPIHVSVEMGFVALLRRIAMMGGTYSLVGRVHYAEMCSEHAESFMRQNTLSLLRQVIA